MHRQGKSIRSIAKELSISRWAVRKYLRSPGLEPCYGPRAVRPSKLDPFKNYIRQRLRDAAPRRLPATVLLREIRERGYEGGISILKDWLAKERPAPVVPEIKRFETEPGYQAQIDWTTIRRGKDRLSAFVAILGFSRWSFVWFTTDEKFETLIDAHERFFDAIGGVPRTILYDNMKTVLIDRDAYGRGQHRFHAGFREFAKHHGFSPRMCAPYRAQTKGKVERFNRYLKESFVWPLESRLKPLGFTLDADTANAEVGVWLRDVANMRVHAETKERPIDRFAREQPFLLPRAPRWRAEGQAVPADLTGIAIQQHDLSIYDAIGDAIGRAVA
ncbi:MAG: IS21 family transposase [Limibaculum sp.]